MQFRETGCQLFLEMASHNKEQLSFYRNGRGRRRAEPGTLLIVRRCLPVLLEGQLISLHVSKLRPALPLLIVVLASQASQKGNIASHAQHHTERRGEGGRQRERRREIRAYQCPPALPVTPTQCALTLCSPANSLDVTASICKSTFPPEMVAETTAHLLGVWRGVQPCSSPGAAPCAEGWDGMRGEERRGEDQLPASHSHSSTNTEETAGLGSAPTGPWSQTTSPHHIPREQKGHHNPRATQPQRQREARIGGGGCRVLAFGMNRRSQSPREPRDEGKVRGRVEEEGLQQCHFKASSLWSKALWERENKTSGGREGLHLPPPCGGQCARKGGQPPQEAPLQPRCRLSAALQSPDRLLGSITYFITH
ncbi:hypothetical protein FQN60_004880 [Etheostoma spectabile]|uniref:Uncharacterized protein n=1 Tax=Etheostoma spectabile TaxID=54343 RepID=A0A5J5DKW6_9PERO|nr:hypothetical protein FQN60_004880 [Etheostoma spectabile]